ncbi:MAG TPA: MoaD/ThiS family protein [Acidimicrobiales bacterium]|nr:MoaD/ThiS family protein [Acidimicrobiales bacterium]
MKVLLRNPKRELEVIGPTGVLSLLGQLGLRREAVLVIVDGMLVTSDATIPDAAVVEIRPVVSGGAGDRAGGGGVGRGDARQAGGSEVER